MREAVPPMDNLARALLMRGARDPAVMLLKAAVRRGGDEKARCEALLLAVQARPTDRVSGPPLSLDGVLVEAVAASGRLYEARAIALGADIAQTVAGVEIAAALEELFEPVDDFPVGWRVRWLDALASGSLSAMTAIEREVSVAQDAPPPLANRVRIGLRLLRGFSLTAATEVRDVDGESAVLELDGGARGRIHARITAADLPGALREAHALAFDGVAGAGEVAAVLSRLVTASERAMAEPSAKLASTVPLGGSGLALFQLRMGNVGDAARLFRNMVAENPSDHESQQHLADLASLERALGRTPRNQISMPEPPARAPSTDALDKRGRKANAAGWAVSVKNVEPTIGWDDGDDSTSVMKSDHEAELLVKAGHPERALPLYNELVRRFPNHTKFAQRRAEIEAMLGASGAAIPIEPTVRRDISNLARTARPTFQKLEKPAPPVDPLGQTGGFEEEEPTDVLAAGRGIAALLQPPRPSSGSSGHGTGSRSAAPSATAPRETGNVPLAGSGTSPRETGNTPLAPSATSPRQTGNAPLAPASTGPRQTGKVPLSSSGSAVRPPHNVPFAQPPLSHEADAIPLARPVVREPSGSRPVAPASPRLPSSRPAARVPDQERLARESSASVHRIDPRTLGAAGGSSPRSTGSQPAEHAVGEGVAVRRIVSVE